MSFWPPTRNSLLAKLASEANASGWEQFQFIYQPAIYRYARSRGLQPDDANEVVQESLLAVHRAMRSWQPTHRPGSFRTWLAETARRITLQTLRKYPRTVLAPVLNDGISVEPASPVDDSRTEEQQWAFFAAAAEVEQQVGEQTWTIFWRTAVQDESSAVVARELNVSVGTVYTARCRVLARIRERANRLLEEQT